MSILVDHEILKAIETGLLIVEPFDPERVQPNSLDVTLHDVFICFDSSDHIVDPYDAASIAQGSIHRLTDKIVIKPGEFMLGATRERFTLPDCIVGQLTGKSSLARLGIMVHVTAGFVDAGFSHPPATITLELYNVSNRCVYLYAGMAVAQMVFTVTSPASIPYNVRKGAKYANQKPATISRYHMNERPVYERPKNGCLQDSP